MSTGFLDVAGCAVAATVNQQIHARLNDAFGDGLGVFGSWFLFWLRR